MQLTGCSRPIRATFAPWRSRSTSGSHRERKSRPRLRRNPCWTRRHCGSDRPQCNQTGQHVRCRLPEAEEGQHPRFSKARSPLDDENKKDYRRRHCSVYCGLTSYPDVSLTPRRVAGLNDTYLLGQAYAQQTPPDQRMQPGSLPAPPSLLPHQAKPTIEQAAEYCYKKYHGSMEGYPAVQTLAQTNLFPPAEYNPTPAPPPPSPADLAAQTVASARLNSRRSAWQTRNSFSSTVSRRMQRRFGLRLKGHARRGSRPGDFGNGRLGSDRCDR